MDLRDKFDDIVATCVHNIAKRGYEFFLPDHELELYRKPFLSTSDYFLPSINRLVEEKQKCLKAVRKQIHKNNIKRFGPNRIIITNHKEE